MNLHRFFSPAHPLQLALGLTVWCIWFVLVYGGLSVGCAFVMPENQLSPLNWLNMLLLVVTIITTLFLLLLARWCWRAPVQAGQNHFNARLAAGLHLTAAISTLVVGLPILVLPPCL